jgi:hypothetical protein
LAVVLVSERLSECCREAVELVAVSCMRLKAVVKEGLSEVYLAIKQKQYEKAEELVRGLLLYLDI